MLSKDQLKYQNTEMGKFDLLSQQYNKLNNELENSKLELRIHLIQFQ